MLLARKNLIMTLLANIMEEKDRTGTLPRNIVVLGSKTTLGLPQFDDLKGKAFFAYIDRGSVSGLDYVLMLIKSLKIALGIVFGKKTVAASEAENPDMIISEGAEKVILLIPNATQVNTEERVNAEKFREFLDSHA